MLVCASESGMFVRMRGIICSSRNDRVQELKVNW